MTEPNSIIVAHAGTNMKRAFHTWQRARDWKEAVNGDYTLTEVLLVEGENNEQLRP